MKENKRVNYKDERRERETLYLSCGIQFSMLDNSIVNETSPKANRDRQANRRKRPHIESG